jgi:hypothetical protein
VIADHPVFSLAELELHDARPMGHGAERRFLCRADHQWHEHKNLAANIESGLWACKRCGASGKLTENGSAPGRAPECSASAPTKELAARWG